MSFRRNGTIDLDVRMHHLSWPEFSIRLTFVMRLFCFAEHHDNHSHNDNDNHNDNHNDHDHFSRGVNSTKNLKLNG